MIAVAPRSQPPLPPGVRLRASRRARRLSLRVDPAKAEVELIVPRGVSLARAAAFAERHRRWIQRHLSKLPPPTPFADGAGLPILGEAYRIRHRPDARGTVWLESQEIHVAGRPEHLPRRLKDWLRAQARLKIGELVREFAAAIDERPGRISLRDTVTRWGSCSPDGNLAFSWRLVLAPDSVFRYVVAHEVAHLRELNHGPRFWTLVRQLVGNSERPRAWLSHYGAGLHRYG